MVEKAEFFRIADEIVEEGRQPSQRSIRERLVRGGSFSDIGPLYVEWAATRGFRPRPTKNDVPDHLRDRLLTVAAEIWGDGVRNGALDAQGEIDKLKAERDALRQALTETSARVDALEDRMKLAPPGAGGAPEKPIEAPRKRGASDGFWDRVMQEIADLLGNRGLRARSIIEELSKETAEEAAVRDGGWGPVRLAHKMRENIRKDRYFREDPDGVLRRLA